MRPLAHLGLNNIVRSRKPPSRPFSSSPSYHATNRDGAKKLMPDGPARTRFAPSPTGYLHLGSLRTALFNYLLARRTQGQFLLRIEDTDQKRLVPDAEQRLCDDLRWAGIEWDEGPGIGGPYGPYKQSLRTPLYQQHAQQLLDAGAAYRCFCSTSVNQASAAVHVDPSQVGVSVGGCQSDCASIPADQSAERAHKGHAHAVRFRKPSRAPSWTDLIYGKVSLDRSSKSSKALPQTASVEGVILLKRDGTPTYHLANVVDDHHMLITHVIRGTEWMSSTPLHVALYNAFSWTPPAFAHVGLLTDKDQAKLSKRNLDTDIASLRAKHGIIPESLNNFVALLGWRNPTKNDVLELQDLIATFDLKFTKGNTMVSFEKLWYLQKHHASKIIDRTLSSSSQQSTISSFEAIVHAVEDAVRQRFTPKQLCPTASQHLRAYVTSILAVDSQTYENPASYVERNKYFFTAGDMPTPAAIAASASSDAAGINEQALYQACRSMMLDSTHLMALKDSTPKQDYSPAELKTHLDAASAAYAAAIEEACEKQVSAAGEDRSAHLKEWRKAMHRHLRQKLTFGLPGPGSTSVMAVLGYEECARRLGA